MVNDGRMTSGKPISPAKRSASATEYAYAPSGTSRPIRAIASANSFRSSPFLMTSSFAPMSSTP